MRALKVFTGLVFVILLSCSQEEPIRPQVSSLGVDANMIASEGLGNPDLKLDFNVAFLSRKDELAFRLSQQVKPAVDELIVVGKDKLAKYNIAPEQISYDPNDPKFALIALLIDQLELAYANGYEVRFVEGPPVWSNPEGMRAVGQCFMDAAGLGGFVHLVQVGVTKGGLNASVVMGTVGRLTVRGALGWVGAAWVAWETGKCLQKLPGYGSYPVTVSLTRI